MATSEQRTESENRFRHLRGLLRGELLRLGSMLLICFVVAFTIREFAFQSFFIPSASMTPTLKVDEHIVVDKTLLISGGIRKGDIVVFKDPGGWIGNESGNPLDVMGNISNFLHYGTEAAPGYLVKRVVAIGGDRVTCCNATGMLIVNGKSVFEPYLSKESSSASDSTFNVLVPAGHIWVLGDNRVGSADSRFHTDLPSKGFVSESDIVGVVMGISWPLNRLRWVLHEGESGFK